MRMLKNGIILFISIVSFNLILGCANEEDDEEQLPQYYIMFYINGDRYLYDKGFSDIESMPFVRDDIGASWASIYATPDVGTFTDYQNHAIKSIHLIAEDSHGNTGTWINAQIYFDNGTLLFTSTFTPQDTITISKNGPVIDTAVEGTFSATVKNGGTTLDITNGSFRVKRIGP